MTISLKDLPEIEPLPEGKITVITTHINSDFDAIASMIAAGKLYPGAVMVFPGSQERNLHNFYLESVTYLFNIAKAREIEPEKVGRLVLVDVRQAGRIGPLDSVLDNEGLSLHIYDHHPDSPDDLKGDMEIVAQVGANCTLMTEILRAKGIDLSPEEATVMAFGIYEDTGSFNFVSTTPRDHLAAAYLLELGADLNVVSELTSRELTVAQVAMLNEFIHAAQTHTIKGVELVITTADSERYVEGVAILAQKMMEMQNLQVLFALVRMEGRIQMVARSRMPRVNVGEIARQLGGGGHPSAAAATIKDLTLPQVVQKLFEILPQTLEPVRTAQDIMVFPVIFVRPDQTLTEARDLMVRYNINNLLVIDSQGEMQGYISRQNVAKALFHGLPGYTVSEFMNTEMASLPPSADFSMIQDLIVEQKQPIVPIIGNGRAIGVITRTDLLNILTSETNVPGLLINNDAEFKFGRTKKILSLMRERLPQPVLNLLADIGRTADRLGYGAFAVGGFVRDILLRQDNLDIDVVIEGDAIHFTNVYTREHPGVRVRQHDKFNTAVLIFPDGLKVDVTTARLEYYESPAALPIVQGGSIRLDLYRRDFTINTLAVYLNEKNFGTVIDYFRALRDIKEGFIRVLHNLSFVEDPTRVFRAIRFEQRFGFKIGKMTANLIHNTVKHEFFRKLSGKRLSGEIRLILQEDDPAPAMGRMAEFDLLKFIHHSLTFDRGMNELFRRVNKVRDWFHLTYLGEDIKPWIVYLLVLFTNTEPEQIGMACQRLRLNKQERHSLTVEKTQADRALGCLLREREIKLSKLYALLSPLSTEAILYTMAKTTREDITRYISNYFTKLRYVKPELTGHDLINMGFKPGPKFKEILDRLLEARLNGEVTHRRQEEDLVRRNYSPPTKIPD